MYPLVLGTGTRVPESIPGPRYPFHYPGTRVKITTRILLNEILFSVLFLHSIPTKIWLT